MSEILKKIVGGVLFAAGAGVVGWVVYKQLSPGGSGEFSGLEAGQVVAGFVLMWLGWRRLMDPGKGVEQQPIDWDAPELVDSITKAHEHIDYFIARVIANVDGAYIKFPFETDTGVKEFVWGYVHNYNDGVFNVSMANVPHSQKGHFRARRDVPQADILDWQIMLDDGKLEGAYSLKGALAYLRRMGVPMNKTLRMQRDALVDLPAEDSAP
jgi:hypothetical protein